MSKEKGSEEGWGRREAKRGEKGRGVRGERRETGGQRQRQSRREGEGGMRREKKRKERKSTGFSSDQTSLKSSVLRLHLEKIDESGDGKEEDGANDAKNGTVFDLEE